MINVKLNGSTIGGEGSFGNPMMKMNEFTELTLPTEVSLFPQTWGWAILLFVTCIISTVLLVKKGRVWWKNRYRRQLIQQVNALDSSGKDISQQLHSIIHSGLTLAYGAEAYRARSLSGSAWLEFLDLSCNGETHFNSQLGTVWNLNCWMNPEDCVLSHKLNIALVQQTRLWLQFHCDQFPSEEVKHYESIGEQTYPYDMVKT